MNVRLVLGTADLAGMAQNNAVSFNIFMVSLKSLVCLWPVVIAGLEGGPMESAVNLIDR